MWELHSRPYDFSKPHVLYKILAGFPLNPFAQSNIVIPFMGLQLVNYSICGSLLSSHGGKKKTKTEGPYMFIARISWLALAYFAP